MPIPAGSWRVVLEGTLRGTQDFATGFWLSGAAYTNHASMQTLSDSIRDSCVSQFLGHANKVATNVDVFKRIRLYAYDGSGGAALDTCESSIPDANGRGISTDGTLPLQTCMVLTLRTARSGRSYRGRMYLPACGTALSDHEFSPLLVDEIGGGLKHWFDAINAANTPTVSVVSQKLGSAEFVTSVSVDSLPDIQRGRAQGLTAVTYDSYPVVA